MTCMLRSPYLLPVDLAGSNDGVQQNLFYRVRAVMHVGFCQRWMHQKHESRFAQLLRDRKPLRRPHRFRKSTFEIDFAAASLETGHAFSKDGLDDAFAIPPFAKMFAPQKDVILVIRMINFVRG